MKFSFQENRQQVEKNYNLGRGEYFKVKEGDNKVRLVSATLPHASDFKGKPTFKWLCQVLDLTDGKIKPYFMPDRIYQNIASLQGDDDYSFDEIPMPYNINIRAENAGKLEVKYSVIPSPKRTPLTPEQEQALKEAPTVEELQAKIRENDKNSTTPADVVEQAGMVTDEDAEKIADEIGF